MDRFALVLRQVVFFLFPIPFLLSFGVDHSEHWTGGVAYAAVIVLALAAAAVGWAAWRRSGRP